MKISRVLKKERWEQKNTKSEDRSNNVSGDGPALTRDKSIVCKKKGKKKKARINVAENSQEEQDKNKLVQVVAWEFGQVQKRTSRRLSIQQYRRERLCRMAKGRARRSGRAMERAGF